jgi:hypothetical protein
MTSSTLHSRARAASVSILVLGAAWLGTATHARADQFVVTDVTYTHSAATTTDSHYRLSPLGPKNWKTPVDYSGGSLHTRVEVKTKPDSVTQTYFQVCLEASPGAACAYLSPIYTKTGVYEWDTPFDKFWYSSSVDWSKGVNKVALIIKDSKLGKPQGDPKFVPTQLTVQVTINSPGSKYMPPGKGSADAGVADASVSSAGDAGRDAAVQGAAGDAATTADTQPVEAPVNDASVRPVPRDGGASTPAGDGGSEPLDDDADPASVADDKESGCAVASGQGATSLASMLAMLLLMRRRRRAGYVS